MNNLVTICGVRSYEKGGVAHLHIEDVARGLGFTEKKDNVDYVMWRRVESHLNSLGFGTCAENGNITSATRTQSHIATAYKERETSHF